MTNSSPTEKRRNKQFIINNSEVLKQYAITNQKKLGQGIILLNLLLIENDILKLQDIRDLGKAEPLHDRPLPSGEDRQLSLKQPIAYIPLVNFWFKIIRLKIKKKYDIDIKKDYNLESKFLLVFVKDTTLESFSIYSVKLV
jgi:hypothetical protein